MIPTHYFDDIHVICTLDACLPTKPTEYIEINKKEIIKPRQ